MLLEINGFGNQKNSFCSIKTHHTFENGSKVKKHSEEILHLDDKYRGMEKKRVDLVDIPYF